MEVGQPLHLFHGQMENFYFRVPANAREVLVNLIPSEPGSAKLFDATGRLVDEMPFQEVGKVLKGERSPSVADEIWHLQLPTIQEDFNFQVGGDAVPLVSTESVGVILGK